MLGTRTSVRVFGIAQGLVLILIVVSIVFYRRRQRELARTAGANFTDLNVHEVLNRATAGRRLSPTINPSAGKKAEAEKPAVAPPLLEAALPAWPPGTPPHEILGVQADAAPKLVEQAFKKLLKKYHPDRFSAAGKGYQKRAHHVILLIQEARDTMLRKNG